jgi:hypothetical protein
MHSMYRHTTVRESWRVLSGNPTPYARTFTPAFNLKYNARKKRINSALCAKSHFWAIFLSPFAGFMFDIDQMTSSIKGDIGERHVLNAAVRRLPHSWLVAQDAIIESQPERFAQIDHVFIGPPGIFLIETKAWQGSYLVHGSEWRRRDRYRWVACSSPTRQSAYHTTMWLAWMQQYVSVALFQKLVHHVHPVITLTHVDWIRATCTPVPIVVGAERLMNYLLSQTQEVLQESEIEEIARLIAMYPRYKEKQPPVCPKCNRAMVLRVAKKGVFRGKKFYGCPNYPYCREICDDLDRCR